jgi:mono/diheme cytochrome c family protein
MKDACQAIREWFGRVAVCCWPWATSLLVLAIAARPAAASDPQAVERYRKDVQPILSKYCFDCHADGAKKGNVSFDTFKSDDELVGKHQLWHAVLKNTRANIMPPAKRPRPTAEEQKVIERWIKYSAFGLDPNDPDPGRVTLRRLNRVEYRNTIRDLLGVDYDTDREFPPDDIGYGFDNIGDVLSFSPLLAEKYIAAGKNIVGAAVPGVAKVMPVTELKGNPKKNSLSFTNGGKLAFAFTVDKAGDYLVVLEATVRGSFEFDTSRVQLVCNLDGQEKLKEDHGWQNMKKLRHEFKGHWQPGEEHRFELELTQLPPAKEGAGKKKGTTNLQGISVRLEGPVDRKDWPYQKSYERIYFRGEAPAADVERRKYAREVLERFVRKAFRRPADDKTLDRLVHIAELVYTQPDKTFEQGVSQALVAVLASPRFLFRMEEADPKTPKGAAFAYIDEYSLASRLSYLIWSTMPDDELFRLAERGELRANLKGQVQRMLQDNRAGELSRNFAGQWLKARNVDHVPLNAPVILKQEGNASKVKLDAELRKAIRLETELFFDHVARTDRSVLEMIDSDYAILNEPLAKFYGIPGVLGKEMRKVALPKDSPRGGVLTHASVLMVTSNPTRTSPVKRGLFVLDNFLGAPPPPPPADLEIPTLEQAAEGAKGEPTMRELLALHRSSPLCSSCHSRMDPVGLGLENFNALGMYREKEHGQAIDAAGKLITGETFTSVHELKRILKDSRRRDFYHCLTEKFLTYALGRGPEYYDVEAIDRIAEQLERDEGRFSTLLMGVIESAPFQKRRNSAADAFPPQPKPAPKTIGSLNPGAL